MPLLDVRGYRKQFTIHELDRAIPAFDDVSFRIDSGEFLLLRGPNGVGKSTLLRCLYRTYLPSAGQAWFTTANGTTIDLAHAADVDILHLRKHEIGHVTQFLRPRPRVSALELAIEPLRMDGATTENAVSEASYWLDAFGLKRDIWQAYPTTFSGGEQQKVNLVRALILPRRLLLLDEPTAALDQGARAALVARLRELKQHGVAMIGVFHHPEDIRELVDRELALAPVHGTVEQHEQGLAYVAE